MSRLNDELKIIRKRFDFLFADGFEIAGTEGGGMGWIVYLHSNKFKVRIVYDRCDMFVFLAPPWARKKAYDAHFIDLESLIGFIHNDLYYQYFKEAPSRIDAQLEKIASELQAHYPELVRFLEKKNFIQIKNELELFREKERQIFLGPYGYKPKTTKISD
jgi:hypothetical protein